MSNVAHWDCWGSHGELQHVNKPVPNSTPEAAMDELLAKARFVFGDQDWSAWTWEARGVRHPRAAHHASPGARESGVAHPLVRDPSGGIVNIEENSNDSRKSWARCDVAPGRA